MWSHDGLRAESEQVTNTVNEGPVPGRRTRSERLPVQRKAIASAATDLIAPSPAPDLAGLDDPFGFHLPGSPAIQRKAGAADAGATSGGAGRPMPAPVQAKMEHAFGADLSSVRIHEGPQAQAIGALAYTQGTDIHFAPGQYQPDSHAGQELLGHELTHVVQQAQGRVSATGQAKGVGLNDDEGLEREADLAGARAARGEIAMTGGALTGGGSAVVQAKYKLNAQKTNELKREIVKRWSFDDEVAADVAKELAEYCTGHNQALTIIQKASYDDFQLAASSKVPPDDFELELITGGGSKGSGKPKKEVDPLVDVRKRIGKKGHDLSLFTKEDLEGILLTKDEGGWDLAIQTTYQRVLLAKQNAEKRQELIQRYAQAKAAGDLVFTAGLLKDAWELAYTIATSPGVNVNTTLASEYTDVQLTNAAHTWHGQPDLDGKVTNIHIPGYPHSIIQDKSTRLDNPDPSRGRQTDFISYWGGNKVNVHANSDVHH